MDSKYEQTSNERLAANLHPYFSLSPIFKVYSLLGSPGLSLVDLRVAYGSKRVISFPCHWYLFLFIILTKCKIQIKINWMHWEYKLLIPNYVSLKWWKNRIKWEKKKSFRHLPKPQNGMLEKLKCVSVYCFSVCWLLIGCFIL